MSELSPRFNTEDVELLERERAFDGFFKLDRIKLRHRCFAGGWTDTLHRELFIRDDAVAVLPYDPVADAVLLIEQFRIGTMQDPLGPWSLEPIAGIMEPGETVESVARREADEEAGLEIGQLEAICHYHVSPGGSQEIIHLLCGCIDSRDKGGFFGLAHEGEDIRALVLPRERAYQALQSGRINNAAAIISIQWLQLNHSRLQQQWGVSR